MPKNRRPARATPGPIGWRADRPPAHVCLGASARPPPFALPRANRDRVNVTSRSAASQRVISKRVSTSIPLRLVGGPASVVPSSPIHTVSLSRSSCHSAAARSQRPNRRARAPISSPTARVSGVTGGFANTPRTSLE